MSDIRRIWVNARFLDRPVTGVERVAREMIGALAESHLDSAGRWMGPDGVSWQWQLLAPSVGEAASPWKNLPLVRAGYLRGHAWEQFDLPRLTCGEWLFSPCNTAPLFKRRQILFLHDAQPFAIPENFSRSFRTWYRILYGIAGRCAAVLLTNSEFSRRELVERVGLREDKFRVCLLGSEHVQRLVPDSGVFERRALPSRFLLAVSSRSPNKNFASVVRALEQLGSDAPPCVIVGQDNPRIFSDAKVCHDRIVRLGYVSDAELVALYRRALVLVFPSFYEGFGLPPLEAMGQGCPVIVAKAGSLPEVGGDAVLYCDPHDPGTLADAVRRIAYDDSLRADLGARGRMRAAEFSWRRCTRILLDALSQASTGERR